MSHIVERLRSTPNWMREEYVSFKFTTHVCDRAPFEAADEIDKLRAENAKLAASNHAYLSDYQEAAAEIEKLRAALQEIKRRTQDAHPMSYVTDYWRIANDALGEKE